MPTIQFGRPEPRDIRRLRTCEICKTDVPAVEVKLFPKDREQNWVLCSPCCDKMKNRTQPKMGNTPLPKKNEPVRNIYGKQAAKIEKGAPEDYKTIICYRCNYSFRTDQTRAGVYFGMTCPYCGKDDQLKKR